jgi:hypothetical protein
MSELRGLVKNMGNAPVKWGTTVIPPHAIGTLPLVTIHVLQRRPIPQLKVMEDDPLLQPFVRTPHQPFSARYCREE